ncbi:hypothetical protein NVP1031O_125 [Vibrio phage 1.031.O._10N.261.46.F8]|nr:hypothetical protein NVP1031O_125 [Vibrio phage 1.031.O._10N.261.46.F8]
MIKIIIESDQAVRSINIDFESGDVTTDPSSAKVTSSAEFSDDHPVLTDAWEEEMTLPEERAPESSTPVERKRSPVGESLNVDVSSIKPREPATPPSIEIPDTTNRAASTECGIENEEL